jgi:predicted nucleotidyltransferase
MKKKVRQLIDALRPFDPERVFLFGSWARHEEDELSDLDVVVIKETTQPFLERLRVISKFLPMELGSVDILVYTPEEYLQMQKDGNAFAEMLTEESRLIYERQPQN